MEFSVFQLVETPSGEARRRCDELIVGFAHGRLERKELQARLLEADPWHPLALYGSSVDAWVEGDLETARGLMWRCLWCMPQDFRALFGMYLLMAEGDRLWAAELLVLAMRRYYEDPPKEDIVKQLTQMMDPPSPVLRLLEDKQELERMLEQTAAVRGGDVPALVPFWAADQLSDLVGDEDDQALVQRILAEPEAYGGVLTGLCSVSGRGFNPGPGAATTAVSLAILGETGRMEYAPAIAARCEDEDAEVRHTAAWALHRIARRHGAGFLAELRRGVEGRSPWPLGAMVQQLWIAKRKPGMEQLLVKLLERRLGDSEGEYELNFPLVADALLSLHRGRNTPLVRKALEANRKAFGAPARNIVKELLRGEGECKPLWASDELLELSLEDVIFDGAIEEMLADDGGGEEWEEEEPEARPKPGRNEPCWCGSGKKYKKCHLAEDEAEDAEPGDELAQRLLRFALDNLKPAEMKREVERFGDALEEEEGLPDYLLQWLIYDRYDKGLGDTPVNAFLRRHSRTDEERERLQAWSAGSASIYEVEEVRPEEGLALLDVMQQTRLFVNDKLTSRSVAKYDYLLARLEPDQGRWLFHGDLMSVPRGCAAQVLEQLRGARKEGESWVQALKRVAPELWRWVLEGAAGLGRLPQLKTSTGEDCEMCRGLYELLDEGQVRERLRGNAEMHEEDDGSFVWVDGQSNVILGWLRISDERMVVETMSRERHERAAGILKELLPRVSFIHIEDEFEKVDLAKVRRQGRRRDTQADIEQGEAEAAVLAHLEKHWAQWPEVAVPALQGRTPREAMKTEEGRAALETLLRDFENRAEREKRAGRPVYDFSRLRAELGL